MSDDFSHFNARGESRMVDVGAKQVTERKAVAEGRIRMRAATAAQIRRGAHAKGDVLAVARVAGIMAAKRTAELVPLCHPLRLTRVDLALDVVHDGDGDGDGDDDGDAGDHSVRCVATVATRERTGVEMESLTAVQVALLTVYDMCKAVDRGMTIDGVRLLHKSGGQSGEWNR